MENPGEKSNVVIYFFPELTDLNSVHQEKNIRLLLLY